MRFDVIHDFGDLLSILDECIADQSRKPEEVSGRLSRLRFSPDLSTLDIYNPYSKEYINWQKNLLSRLIGKDYSVSSEGHSWISGKKEISPFPFNLKQTNQIGYWTIIVGHILQKLDLRAGARVLEVGFGYGNLTELLLRSGIEVHAIDPSASFCSYLEERFGEYGDQLQIACDDLLNVKLDAVYDAVVFFESFHHMSDHVMALQLTRQALKNNNSLIYFGAEPIVPDNLDDPVVPYPWGVRLDGRSLFTIRKNGWMELGFQRGYFEKVLHKESLETEYYFLNGYHHSSLFVARLAKG